MRVPVSWLREFVDIDVPVELLAERLTLAGLEVASVEYIGVPQQKVEGVRSPVANHLVWDRERLLLGKIREIKAHPNADKLVLAMVEIGDGVIEQCVTGAPNLFQYKDQGEINPPLWTAFAAEGAEVWDGHSDEPKLMILKEKALRGIPNRSMVCSEKELGMSGEHEGVILMHEDPGYAAGSPLQDVLGDVILEIELTPNLARAYSILGVAREVAALLGKQIKPPSYDLLMEGASIEGAVSIDIREAELNPRFTLTLLRDVTIKSSPEWVQRRLRAVGQRPINNIVDVTNYITFEIGQPLHSYDYDKLVERAGRIPNLITRLAEPGETLETLDEVKRQLETHNILVCDSAGVLGLGGVIGGAETEITPETRTVLLEAANWNFINTRRTMQTQKLFTDAGTRFSRGVHPSQALLGVKRGAELMRQFSGAKVAQGVIDVYPAPPMIPSVDLSMTEVQRIMGVDFPIERAVQILNSLEFEVRTEGNVIHAVAPDHRTDIGTDTVGRADLIEEIARIYGYDQLPNTIIADAMPPQWSNVDLEREEHTRDVLAGLGLRETINYRLTTPEVEQLLTPNEMSIKNGAASENPLFAVPSEIPYVALANPITADKTVMRHMLLGGMLETAQRNARFTRRQQVFEIGSVYLPRVGQLLPDEPRRVGILMIGSRRIVDWAGQDDGGNVDYFDLKGVVDGLLEGLHVRNVSFSRAQHATFHPGRSAHLHIDGKAVGVLGELHPLVAQNFELTDAPVLAAELDLDALLGYSYENYRIKALPVTPPVLQDIALIVRDDVAAASVEAVIVNAGGDLLKSVRLFDVYHGEPIPAGHKSLAYSLTYQTDARTLTDKEVARVHQQIVKAVERELGAQLRM